MLLRPGPPNWSRSCRHPPTASGTQQGRHPCPQQQPPTLITAHSAAALHQRQPLTASSAASAVSHLPELQQLQLQQQQLQQLQVPRRRPADVVTSYTSNGHSPSSITSSSSTAPQFVPRPTPSPRPRPYRIQQAPTSLVSLLVIEAFAGSYSAGRLTARLNSSNTGMSVAAYAAVELDPAFMQRAPDSAIFGIPDHENRMMIINGSITDPAVHGQLLLFVQQMLQQSADGSGPVIDGVMLLGGPPCTMYSNCQTYQLPRVIEPDPDSFRRKLFASDRVVTGFLHLYSIIKAACADTRWPHPTTKQPVPSCILMENPFSPSYMPIKYTPQEIAASQGQLKSRQIKMIEKQNLSGRHFLQPYLAHTGGELYISLHCWCSYAHLTHPKKLTYVFSDLKGLQDTPCICRLCRPEGSNIKSVGVGSSGRLIEVPVYQQHYIKVQEMETGDGGERATWPDAWLDRMAWLFSSSILARRRLCYSSSGGRSSGDSGGLQLPIQDRQHRCSSTDADNGGSSTVAGNGSSTTAGDGSSNPAAAGKGSSRIAVAGNGSSRTAAGNGSSTAAAGSGSSSGAGGDSSSSGLVSSTGSVDAAAAAAADAALLGRRGSGASRARRRGSREFNSSSSDQSSSSQSSATSSSGQSSNTSSSISQSITSSRSAQSSASSSSQQASRQHDDHTPEPCSTASSGDQSTSNNSCAASGSGDQSSSNNTRAIGSSGDQSSRNNSCAASSSGQDSNAGSSSVECISPNSRGQSKASSSRSCATGRPSSSTGGSGGKTPPESSNISGRRTRNNSRSTDHSSSSSSSSVSNSSASISSSVTNSATSSNSGTRRDQDRMTMERHRQLPSIFDMPL